MSKNIFFISDMHFGHVNMCTFVNYDGTKARNFNSFEEADEAMIKNWNDTVNDGDVVYVLGDVAYSCRKEYADSILVRLKGQKKLIAGNHDLWSAQWYLKHFKYVRGCCHLDNFYLSHTPIHPNSKGRFKLNIHGHIHGERVMRPSEIDVKGRILSYEIDPFYFNVSADYNYRYTPVPYEEIQEYYQKCLDEGLLQPIPKKER
jgi:calcineurin-like phosphoesterase family protein